MSNNNDLDAVVAALSAPEPQPSCSAKAVGRQYAKNYVQISVTTVGIPPKAEKCPAGTTVAEFKKANGYTGAKLATKNADGSARILSDDEVITGDMSLFTATAKKNG